MINRMMLIHYIGRKSYAREKKVIILDAKEVQPRLLRHTLCH